jgi:hypothetical protein
MHSLQRAWHSIEGQNFKNYFHKSLTSNSQNSQKSKGIYLQKCFFKKWSRFCNYHFKVHCKLHMMDGILINEIYLINDYYSNMTQKESYGNFWGKYIHLLSKHDYLPPDKECSYSNSLNMFCMYNDTLETNYEQIWTLA